MNDFEIGDIVSIKNRERLGPWTHYSGDRGMIVEITGDGIHYVDLWLCRRIVRFSYKQLMLVQKLEET